MNVDLLIFYEVKAHIKSSMIISVYLIDADSGKVISYVANKTKSGSYLFKEKQEKRTQKVIESLFNNVVPKLIERYHVYKSNLE